jgi:hypothetical protein
MFIHLVLIGMHCITVKAHVQDPFGQALHFSVHMIKSSHQPLYREKERKKHSVPLSPQPN